MAIARSSSLVKRLASMMQSRAYAGRRIRDSMEDASPRAKGARRCTNPECEYGNRWVVGKMATLKNSRLLCRGKGCHTRSVTS